jgi:tetratricopeptide (TPR) repeat protein
VPDHPAGSDSWLNAASLRYQPEAERARVKEDMGEAFYMMAQVASLKARGAADDAARAAESDRAAKWNELAERYGDGRFPRAVREQRAVIAELRGNKAEADRLRREAEAIPLQSARDLFLAGTQLARDNRHREALRHLERATELDPENFSAWFVRGTSHIALGQYGFAVMCYGACVSLRPDSAPAWLNRGLALAGLRHHAHAIKDYTRAIELNPGLTDAYVYRAGVREAERDLAGAEADYTQAIEKGTTKVRVYFRRATVRHLRKDFAGAKVDREAGFKLTPTDELDWIARSENRQEEDPKGALADVEEALKLNPLSVHGLQQKAHILGERLNRADDALEVLNKAVEWHPDHVPTIAGRGVALARAGKRDAALRDAKEALRRDTHPQNVYQVACIYALTAKTHPEDKREALRLLWDALRGGFGFQYVHNDTDLDALRKDQDFKDLVKDAEALRGPRPKRDVPGGMKK